MKPPQSESHTTHTVFQRDRESEAIFSFLETHSLTHTHCVYSVSHSFIMVSHSFHTVYYNTHIHRKGCLTKIATMQACNSREKMWPFICDRLYTHYTLSFSQLFIHHNGRQAEQADTHKKTERKRECNKLTTQAVSALNDSLVVSLDWLTH